uniref:RHS repeat domain-containing protein n=1 Tax=Flavobacterium ajazii TaxID=2692318 RepID=UPI003743FFC1
WEYLVYDKLDRLVLTQDANLRVNNKWLFTKYDAFGRPVYTGEYSNTAQTTRATVQTLADQTSSLYESRQTTALNINGFSVHYSNAAFPDAGINLFTINYYDNYENIDLDGGTADISYGITPITNAKGLSTCSKVRVLNNLNWITTVVYYDSKERPVYNYAKNAYLDVINTTKTKFDFAGKVMETTNTHQKGSASPITIIDTFTYDNAGRVLTQKQKINSQAEEFIADNSYNELGQLISKGVGGKTTQSRLQIVNYDYNIRGWLKNINNANNIGSDLFAFQINYNNAADPTKSLYNGNISQTFWKTANTDTGLRNYTYTYDALNRLTNAVDNISRYNESLSYDKNGNILTLLRLGNTDEAATQFGQMDNLVYTYDSGNKLMNVADSSGSAEGFKDTSTYTYDNNGNMLQDSGKIITSNISYNHLNLPWVIPFNGKASMSGRTWSASIQYVYDAAGQKVSKNVIKREFQGRQQVTLINSTTEYAGGYI